MTLVSVCVYLCMSVYVYIWSTYQNILSNNSLKKYFPDIKHLEPPNITNYLTLIAVQFGSSYVMFLFLTLQTIKKKLSVCSNTYERHPTIFYS